MSAIASTILAHKFLVALAIASLTVTGGAVAVGTSANQIGTMSFTVNSSINVVSLANMDFGNLNPGQSSTYTSSAKVNITSSGNYTLFLENGELIDQVFSSFNVNVAGLGSSPVIISTNHPWAVFQATKGVYSVTVTVLLTVDKEIGHSISVTNAPFLGLSTYPPHIEPMPPVPATGDHDSQSNEDN
ncbi:MAG: hypothetical protein ACRECH_05835 [Nitrososphaerales archaeon]